MLALLLLPPLAAAALAVRLAADLERGERAVLAAAVGLALASALLSPDAPLNDPWTHFQHVRAALADPRWLLDPWDRPGFTLLYAGPAAWGLRAARCASAIPAAIALAATMQAARALRLPRPWAAGALLLAQYDFFGQASSTMTELPFAAAFAVAAWGLAAERDGLAAAGLAWLAVTRPEGPLFAALGAAALLSRRRLAPAALALSAFPAYLGAGALAFHDALWWIHRDPYRGLVGARLDLARVADSFFFEALRRGQPPVLRLLICAGAAAALARPAARLRWLLVPVAASFALLTFLRIGPTDAWLDSRYLVAIAPALALLAAAGLDAAVAAFPRLAPPALLALAATGAAGALRWHWGLAAGPRWAGAALQAALLGAAALLWLSRARIAPALAALLLLPLAAAPPGAYGGLRPQPAAWTRAAERAPPAGAQAGSSKNTPVSRFLRTLAPAKTRPFMAT